MMRALRLDYRQDRRSQLLAGLLVLLLALAAAGATGWYYQGLYRQQAAASARIAQVESRARPQAKQAAAPMDAEKLKEVMAFSNRVVEKLNLPWDDLFAALEAAKPDNIALLGVEPDAKARVLKVSGEAKNFEAMFEYLRALREGKMLQDAYLTEHKIDDQNPDKPVRFSLEATWSAKP